MAWDRKRAYFALMGTCVALFVLAGAVVRFVSVSAAIALCVVAAVIPPFAAVVGNLGTLSGRQRLDFDDPPRRNPAPRPPPAGPARRS